jgi:hypothetical protein
MMIGVAELTTCWREVPGIGAGFGAPSKTGGVIVAPLRWTVAVWGTPLAMRASRARGVPGTDAFTFSLGLSSGIQAKSAGSSRPGT